jgi:hypothetical protein
MSVVKKKISSKEKSKREHFLQIYTPLIIFVVLAVFAVIMIVNTSFSNTQNIQQWADISAILIIVPVLFSILVFLALIILLVVGLGKLLKWIPVHFSNFHVFIMKIAIFIMNGSNKIVFPVINARSKLFSLKSLWKKGRI